MNAKSLIWGGMVAGSFVGNVIPYFFGGDLVAYIVWSSIGGLAGIWVGFKVAKAAGAL